MTSLIPEEIAALPAPRFGCYAAEGAEVNGPLLAALAQAQPQGSVVVVSSSKQGKPTDFPEHPNLHWVGPCHPGSLSTYCQGFNVCLLPFADTAQAESFDPVIAWTYLAAGRPVVSSGLEVVREQFGDVVLVASHPDEFIDFCSAAVRHLDPFIAERITWGLELAARDRKPGESFPGAKSKLSPSRQRATFPVRRAPRRSWQTATGRG